MTDLSEHLSEWLTEYKSTKGLPHILYRTGWSIQNQSLVLLGNTLTLNTCIGKNNDEIQYVQKCHRHNTITEKFTYFEGKIVGIISN